MYERKKYFWEGANMENIFKWLTVSSWIEETILFFQEVDIQKEIKIIREEVKEGKYFNGKKDSTVLRIFSEIVQKYLKDANTKTIVYNICNSKMNTKEKAMYLLVPFLKNESLRAYFTENYIFPRFQEGQNIFTQKDLDIFFHHIFTEKRDRLPDSINETLNTQGTLGESSIKKARNQIFKFLEDFNFANKQKGQIIVKKPKFSLEWFLFALAFHYPEKQIDIKKIIKENQFSKYLINEQDIMEYINNAIIDGKLIQYEDFIEINSLVNFIKIAA
jgi:hypothetical protein